MKTVQFIPEKEFYTKWSEAEKPFLYVYASAPDRIKKPKQLTKPYIFCGTDETKAEKTVQEIKANGNHAFCYQQAKTKRQY